MIAPLMIDLAGPALLPQERERLADPRVGGVILFTRNYRDRAQLVALVEEVRAVRSAPLLLAVDHEGGRVQRFHDGFSRLPAMASLGWLYAQAPDRAVQAAQDIGLVLASELLECGLDFSFTPVLDLAFGRSAVIGNRAFSAAPEAVVALAGGVIAGLQAAGSAAVGKHFPGHGHVEADSHVDLPVDLREFSTLWAQDIVPFARLSGQLQGIMPAHVVYERCAPEPAGFSEFWLQDVLRQRLGFTGAVFSDDLAMAGALGAGSPAERARAAFRAGCDMALLCNDPVAVDALLAELGEPRLPAGAGERLDALRGHPQRVDEDACAAARARLDVVALEGWAAR